MTPQVTKENTMNHQNEHLYNIHLLYNLRWRSPVHPVPPHINTFLILHHESSSPRLLHLFLCSLILCTIVGYFLFPLTVLKWVTLVRCLFFPLKVCFTLEESVYNVQSKGFLEKSSLSGLTWCSERLLQCQPFPLLKDMLQLLPISSYLVSEKYQTKLCRFSPLCLDTTDSWDKLLPCLFYVI